MNTQLLIGIFGGLSAIVSLWNYFQWMNIYSKTKGYSLIQLFRKGVYKPFKIEPNDEILEKDAKVLNRKNIYFILFFVLAFVIAFILNLPIINYDIKN